MTKPVSNQKILTTPGGVYKRLDISGHAKTRLAYCTPSSYRCTVRQWPKRLGSGWLGLELGLMGFRQCRAKITNKIHCYKIWASLIREWTYRSHNWANFVHINFPFGPRRRSDGELLVSPATSPPLPDHGFVAAAGSCLPRLRLPRQLRLFLSQEWWTQLVDAGSGKFPALEEGYAGEERRPRWCEGGGSLLSWRQVFLGSCAKINFKSLYLKKTFFWGLFWLCLVLFWKKN